LGASSPEAGPGRPRLVLLLHFATFLAGGAAPAAAQPSGLAEGRVIRVVAGDSVPVAGARVVLHRVALTAQGVSDSVRADAQGRFRIRFRVDSGAAYLLSVRHHGIEYFSNPLDPDHPDTALVIAVADTSATAPVRTRERTLLISGRDESGTRTVVDWFVIENAGERTRTGDSARPAWGAPLPPDAQRVELADARLSPFAEDALSFRGDSVLVLAPLAPGRKELVLQYRLPGSARRIPVPLNPGMDSLLVLLEEPGARVLQPALAASAVEQLEGRSFRRWAGVPAEGALELEFPGVPPPERLVLLVLVIVAGTGLATLALLALRERRRTAAADQAHPLYLADAIARLDSSIQDRPAASADELARYRAERARLRARLDAALAAERRKS
jgi:hypothetical protein